MDPMDPDPQHCFADENFHFKQLEPRPALHGKQGHQRLSVLPDNDSKMRLLGREACVVFAKVIDGMLVHGAEDRERPRGTQQQCCGSGMFIPDPYF